MPTSYTPSQGKAIAWYAQTNGYRLSLATYPYFYFIKPNGKTIRRNIIALVSEFKEAQKDAKKA